MTAPVELRVGRWVPTREGSKAKPRHVVWVGANRAIMWPWSTVGWVHDPLTPTFVSTGHDRWSSFDSFRAWIDRHNAKLEE